MKLFIVTAIIAACGAAKLDHSYLPPVSAATAGGNSGDIQLPFERSGSQTVALEGIPKGGAINEFQGVVVDAASPGTRSSDQETGLGGPRKSYGSQDSKVGEAAFFKTSNSNAQPALNLEFSKGSPSSFQHSQINNQNGPVDVQASGTQLSGQFGQTVGPPFERIQAARDRAANTVKFENEVGPESFSYSFETDNGIAAEESGVATNGVQAKGGFSYTGDDGQVYSVTYTADEEGYHPVGDHLPTPPPIPEEILKSLEQNAREEAAGLIDDGSYDARKYNEGGDYSESDGVSGQYNRNQARPGTGNFGQSGFTNLDQSGRLTTANENFGNTNKRLEQNFGSNLSPNKFDAKSPSRTGNFDAQRQQATGFGDRLVGHTSAFATSFTSGQGTDDQVTKNTQNSPVAEVVGAAQIQQSHRNGIGLDKELSVGKDSIGAGTIQEVQSAKGSFESSSRKQFSGITQASYLPPRNQETGKVSINLHSRLQQSIPQSYGEQQSFGQFSSNSQLQQFSQQNNIENKKPLNGATQFMFSQNADVFPSIKQSSDLQGRPEFSGSFESTKNNIRANSQYQGVNNQPSAIHMIGPVNSPDEFSQTEIATSSTGKVNGQVGTSKFGQFTSFNNGNVESSPFVSSQRQSQNQHRFNSQQFPTNSHIPSLNHQTSNAFKKQSSSLDIKSDQPYNYNRPSRPFQADSEHTTTISQQFTDSNRFSGSSSNQFNRLNQQYSNNQQTVALNSNLNQKLPTSPVNSQFQIKTEIQPSSFTSNQQTLSGTDNTYRGYQSGRPKPDTINFNQRVNTETSSQVLLPSNLPSVGTSAQLSVKNQQSAFLQNGYRKQISNNIQNAEGQNGFVTSTQQLNQFSRPDSNAHQSSNVGIAQEDGNRAQSSTLGEIYQYDKPAESLPMPNKDQNETSSQSGIQSFRSDTNTQIFRPQNQFASQSVAGRGEIFDSSRKPPSYDSETGYHYR